ncbi:MerR family transcriptional regulator [Clostridium beijerinckii]|uniref:MerR family transcriptional regulator n=1 Tax=Clostridium beijerinckii TaxID=1520 RepID=UPI00098C29C4|nr:helix-turn-helix domain-containing protein [Clostridium beijerinckii]MBA8933621.1 DNA-binding transcriptional MerR regulator [Clostridium beijerinckii]NRU37820.1 DNA-binding transcriptional MerR regulator [Clostridium beijerinckii]NSA98902.1 DNA-binding transcriptional MerR regulator [Clostridium beijerinckii]OOM54639.1 multidrug-efflux transporter 1 regulator [Clostridium beijerinckii]OOM70628.1 multidrug-efflux transporter 1 regulator [Clostridium beijerinckii]
MTNLYTIGEVSRYMNISTKILRHYDHLNLLKPCYISPDTKYRYFSYDQLFIIDVIRYLNKTLLIPLEDIKNILDENKDYDKLLTFLESHKEQLDKKIAAIEYSKQLTDSMISDIKELKKSPKKIETYEQYLMSRNFYYLELNTSIYDIDKHVTRHISNITNIDITEYNTMCLLFSLSEYTENKNLNVKGFGVFSDKKIPQLKFKNLREGRYINQSFIYSEENTMSAINNITKYADIRNMKLDDTAFLVSKMVDLSVSSKYDYFMELQIMHHM